MEPAGGSGIGYGFADGHSEGDDVVLDAGFEFEDAGDVDFGASADGLGGVLRDLASFGQGFGGGEFDVEPAGEFAGIAPHPAHGLARIPWNQGLLPVQKNRPKPL